MAKFVFTPNDSSEIANEYDAVIIGAGGADLLLQFKQMN